MVKEPISGILTAFAQQAKVFLASDACRLEIVLDNEHRDLSLGRNHHRTRRPFPAVSAVAALLVFKVKSGPQKDAFQRLPVHRRQAWHRASSNGNFTSLDRNPRWALPHSLGVAFVAGFFEHPIESSRIRTACHKGAHGFIHGASSRFGIGAGASHIKRHCMGDVLVAFAPDIDRIIDVHRPHTSTGATFNQAGFLA